VEQAVRAQFQEHLRSFGTLRRRRNELEYPSAYGAALDAAEAVEAHDIAAMRILLDGPERRR